MAQGFDGGQRPPPKGTEVMNAYPQQPGGPPQPPAYGAPPQPPYGGGPPQPAYGAPAAPPGYGAPASQPGYGAPPAQAGYGAPPAQAGYGAPPAQGGYGPPQGYGAPSAQPGYGAPQAPVGPPAGGYGAPPAAMQPYGAAAPAGWQAPAQPHAHAAAPGAIPCPECGQPTTSLKQYTMIKFLVFVYFFAFWRRQVHLACPSCMRKEIGMKTLINVIPANLLWLFLVLPWNTVLFCMTFAEGHSDKVRQAMR